MGHSAEARHRCAACGEADECKSARWVTSTNGGQGGRPLQGKEPGRSRSGTGAGARGRSGTGAALGQERVPGAALG